MPKLTALEVRNMKTPCRLPDGAGLFYEITDTGIKRWLHRFKLGGKNGMYIIGRYPELSLETARKEHRKANALIREGINPAQARRQKKLETIAKESKKEDDRAKSFEFVALEWIKQKRGGWSQPHTEAVIRTLENNVFSEIGPIHIESITPPQVLKILRTIESRGSLEIAKKVLQRMNAIFRYAIQTGRATYNPAADMKGALMARPVAHLPAVFDSNLSQLLQDISKNPKLHTTTRLALQFTALTACRSGEVRGASWSEFDLAASEWRIPAKRMKMRREHIVPLSKQALAIIKRAGLLFGTDGLVFPSARNGNKPMSDNAMSKALRDMGYQGQATPHGFRSSFSSAAYERSKFPSEVIEKCLAHEEKNKIKGAYNRAEYLEQRRQLMQWWGNELQKLEQGLRVLESKNTVNESSQNYLDRSMA